MTTYIAEPSFLSHEPVDLEGHPDGDMIDQEVWVVRRLGSHFIADVYLSETAARRKAIRLSDQDE